MLNKTQSGLLKLNTLSYTNDKAQLIEEIYSILEVKLGKLTRVETSNNYIWISVLAEQLLNAKYSFTEYTNAINEFFDNNKFDGYNSGTYSGLRQALLELTSVKDVNLAIKKVDGVLQAGNLEIIALLEDDIKLEEVKNEIANQIHKYMSVGIVSVAIEDCDNVRVSVNAKTGQAIDYYINLAKLRNFNLEVSYTIDYEQGVIPFNIEDSIKEQINNLQVSKYLNIGSNIHIQDFYAIVRQITCLASVSVVFSEVDDQGQEIASFDNKDIQMQNWEMFNINAIHLTPGN